ADGPPTVRQNTSANGSTANGSGFCASNARAVATSNAVAPTVVVMSQLSSSVHTPPDPTPASSTLTSSDPATTAFNTTLCRRTRPRPGRGYSALHQRAAGFDPSIHIAQQQVERKLPDKPRHSVVHRTQHSDQPVEAPLCGGIPREAHLVPKSLWQKACGEQQTELFRLPSHEL